MLRTLKILTVHFILFAGVLYSQEASYFPADSLLTDPKIPIIRKTFILPIAAWQRLSFSTRFLDCQFFPSCSNYGAQAISQKGVIPGLFMTSDRIVRCNPAALKYHAKLSNNFYTEDLRIKDPVNLSARQTDKSPLLAAVLSVIPGSGRIYGGRTWDGIFGFIMVSIPAASAYRMKDDAGSFGFMMYAAAAAVFYGGEVYGAWRTAKFYRKVE